MAKTPMLTRMMPMMITTIAQTGNGAMQIENENDYDRPAKTAVFDAPVSSLELLGYSLLDMNYQSF